MISPLAITLTVVSQIADSLKLPDQTIMPFVIIQTPRDLKVMSALTQNDVDKTRLFSHDLPDFIKKSQAHTAIFVSTMHFTEHKLPENFTELPRSSSGQILYEHLPPAKRTITAQEMLVVIEVTAKGYTVYTSKIIRSADLPPLFEKLSLAPHAEAYLYEDVQNALQSVARSSL